MLRVARKHTTVISMVTTRSKHKQNRCLSIQVWLSQSSVYSPPYVLSLVVEPLASFLSQLLSSDDDYGIIIISRITSYKMWLYSGRWTAMGSYSFTWSMKDPTHSRARLKRRRQNPGRILHDDLLAKSVISPIRLPFRQHLPHDQPHEIGIAQHIPPPQATRLDHKPTQPFQAMIC